MTEEQIRDVAFCKPAPEDSRTFLVRLLSSLRILVKPKMSGGRLVPDISIKGGTDF